MLILCKKGIQVVSTWLQIDSRLNGLAWYSGRLDLVVDALKAKTALLPCRNVNKIEDFFTVLEFSACQALCTRTGIRIYFEALKDYFLHTSFRM